ncbi:MAG: DnaJ domain-containing protein [Bacteroidetes bacterium]|nr:DnaJ domain-containing protein [Bacteroidota bacterium]
MAERNYYILLEVKSNATFDEIKISYRALAKKYHPDKNIGNKAAEEYFKEIQQAYTVLSNPEKRKKYDLKFSYYNKTQAQKREYATGPQYTSGSAYQYTQQKTQTKKTPEKKDNTESWQILVSIGIALILLYFIISYSAEKNTASSTTVPQLTEKVNDKKIEPSEPAISNFDSPYSTYFGAEISDPESKNSITIFTTGNTEAVVCLVEKDAPNRTIRNQYMVSQTEFKMNEIPDGEYFLRIYYGTDWNPKKTFLNNSIKGGFNTEKGFVEINTGKDALKMKKMKNGSIDSYSTYEIKIDPVSNQNIKSISPAEFFQK